MEMLKAGQYEKDGVPVLAMLDFNQVSGEDMQELLQPPKEIEGDETRV